MIFVDLETTGLLVPDNQDPEKQPGIVQIGIIKEHLGETTSYSTYCNPEKSFWDPGAIKTHGISPDQVTSERTLPALFPELCDLFSGEDVWVGFNLEFDKNVLFYQLWRYNLHTRFCWPRKTLDIMKIAGQNMEIAGKQGNKNPKLVELFAHFFPSDKFKAHDALGDIEATYECWVHMRDLGWL